MAEFVGESERGEFQEALDASLRLAAASAGHSDAGVVWRLLEVSGSYGTIAGLRKLAVKIDGQVS